MNVSKAEFVAKCLEIQRRNKIKKAKKLQKMIQDVESDSIRRCLR